MRGVAKLCAIIEPQSDNRNRLPHNPDSLNACYGIVTRTGYCLSSAARAMIELLMELDRTQVLADTT